MALQRFKEDRIIIHTLTRQKAKWIVTPFVGTAFIHIIERKIEEKVSVKERRRRGRKHLLDHLKKTR